MKINIIGKIEDYSPKENIVGFRYMGKYYTAVLMFTGTIRSLDENTLLLWIYSDDIKESYKLSKPSRVSVAIPLLYEYEFTSKDTNIYESNISGASSIVGIKSMNGIIDKKGNGFFLDESGAYIQFGDNKIIVGEDGVHVVSPKMSIPVGSDRDSFLKEHDLTFLPSFMALPIPKDVIDFDFLSNIFSL